VEDLFQQNTPLFLISVHGFDHDGYCGNEYDDSQQSLYLFFGQNTKILNCQNLLNEILKFGVQAALRYGWPVLIAGVGA
jgi:hypothetical protein